MYVTKCIHRLTHSNPHIVRPFWLYTTVNFFKTFSPLPFCVCNIQKQNKKQKKNKNKKKKRKKKKKKKKITHLINEFN